MIGEVGQLLIRSGYRVKVLNTINFSKSMKYKCFCINFDYLGHTVNFKTSKQSFKSKKVLWNDPADWVIFENTQEPIIEESVFLIVQKIRQGRRRPTKMGDMGMFSGLLYCADCGGKMYLCRANHFKPEGSNPKQPKKKRKPA